MNCPSCQAELVAGQERCPACGGMVAPPVLGALAPDPLRATPPARARAAAPVASLRRREASWKDEVRERVQRRRRGKASELPLFDEPLAPTAPEAAPPAPAVAPEPDLVPPVEPPLGEELPEPTGPSLLGDEAAAPEPAEPRLVFGPPADAEPADDLPLRPSASELRLEPPVAHDPVEQARNAPAMDAADAEALADAPEEDWTPHIEIPTRPVERPAAFGDRFEAAAVDAGVLLALYATILYFASRIAHADFGSLLGAWPWLLGYLGGLGLAYAAWFTGTTGQTPGKMLFGLRVVVTDGQPPSYLRALLRAALGAAGSAALGLGSVPLFFDPARRAFHDRLLRTRVVKS
jgi:uncharacterized RDD family membrane protein YckC